jgi:hypothetical protein
VAPPPRLPAASRLSPLAGAPAALVAVRLQPAVADYLVAGHRSTEPGATRAMDALDLTPLITHRIGIDDFETGFSEMISGNSGKVVMDW